MNENYLESKKNVKLFMDLMDAHMNVYSINSKIVNKNINNSFSDEFFSLNCILKIKNESKDENNEFLKIVVCRSPNSNAH